MQNSEYNRSQELLKTMSPQEMSVDKFLKAERESAQKGTLKNDRIQNERLSQD